jgi:hypothetical protein
VIVVRNVFQAKYGKGDELVALFKQATPMFKRHTGGRGFRTLVDLSGPMFTVVTEFEWPSLAASEDGMKKMFADPEFGKWFAGMPDLIDHGSRDIWTVVE